VFFYLWFISDFWKPSKNQEETRRKPRRNQEETKRKPRGNKEETRRN
jgi:hypothetical protein